MATQATAPAAASIPPLVLAIIEREAGRIRESLDAAERRADDHRRGLDDELKLIAFLKRQLDELAAVHRSDLMITTDTEGN